MHLYVFLSLTSDIKVEINDRLDINNCSVRRSEDNSVCVCVCVNWRVRLSLIAACMASGDLWVSGAVWR